MIRLLNLLSEWRVMGSIPIFTTTKDMVDLLKNDHIVEDSFFKKIKQISSVESNFSSSDIDYNYALDMARVENDSVTLSFAIMDIDLEYAKKFNKEIAQKTDNLQMGQIIFGPNAVYYSIRLKYQ